MQGLNWDDLRYVLALFRYGTLAEASRRLGVSDTTVARRLKALEREIDAEAFLRDARGNCVPTEVGRILVARAERMEAESEALAEDLGTAGALLADTVTISSVPLLTHRVLLPALARLQASHPSLSVELVPEGRNLDLTRREADLALRFSRPMRGGLAVQARKLAVLDFAVFAAASRPAEDPGPWILYADTVRSLPQARWSTQAQTAASDPPAGLRVTDAETALEAAALGIGRVALPLCVGARDTRLRQIDPPPRLPPLPQRDVWLLSHAGQADRRAVEVAKAWLAAIAWSDGPDHASGP